MHEVLSYGVIGYKPDPKKRAVVFISGWRDLVVICPITRNPELVVELQPYIKGKGTLWFKLDESLPIDTVTAEYLFFWSRWLVNIARDTGEKAGFQLHIL